MKKKINAVLFALFATVTVGGCATPMVWIHTSNHSALNFEKDKKLCWSEALLKVSSVSEGGFPILGGESLDAKYPNVVKVSYSESIPRGVASGLAARARNAAIQAHFEACMYAKGYILVEEGKAPQFDTPE